VDGADVEERDPICVVREALAHHREAMSGVRDDRRLATVEAFAEERNGASDVVRIVS
jgi:hypothetical protein